jgi:hypothetical protein
MWKRMSTDRDFRVSYEVDGQPRERVVTLSGAMCHTPEMVEYNCRVMVRQSTQFKTARSYNSFKVTGVEPVPTDDAMEA